MENNFKTLKDKNKVKYLIVEMNQFLVIIANNNTLVINELIKKLIKLNFKKKQLIIFK